MATLTSIDPRKSKRTGDIPFTIEGTGFLTSDLSSDFSGAVFYTDISANGGAITDIDKLNLSVSDTAGSIAGIETAHTFPRSFDVSVTIDRELFTLPATNGAKITALKSYDDIDPTTYFEVWLGYSDGVGYFIGSEASIAGSIVYNQTVAIDPASVNGLKIIRSEDRITGLVKTSGPYAPVGDYLGFSTFDQQIFCVHCARIIILIVLQLYSQPAKARMMRIT